MDEIKLGRYKHFKGNFYEVVGFAKHSETLEDMVVYRALYGAGGTWIRPANMWNENVVVDGKTKKRFEFIGDLAAEEQINVIFENEKIKVEEIVSSGVSSPTDFWYNNLIGEWVSINAGEAILEFENNEITLRAGENYYIKAHTKHRVKYTSPDCKWLCVYVK